ncbi:alpha/beta fold hydrolase [Streptomyces sp. GD-15H]|uniref:alpha/beta fold hydrolase n=1 Tax=Streptomyces sp. GD-15H TaxID=3129112 RepID=UPI003873BEAA
MAITSVNGIQVGYEDEGSGEPVLLIHGHPFDRTLWEPQLVKFAGPLYRLIVPDLRGFGETTVVPGKTHWEEYARDLAALLDHLGVGSAVVGGISMGGQLALEFYRLFPERVRALLIADSFAQTDTEEKRAWRYETADRLEAEGMAGYADEVLTSMVTPYNVEAQSAVAEHVLRMMRGAPPEGAAVALRSRAERPDYTGMLDQIAVPTLVVVGRDDSFTTVQDAELLQQQIPNATLAVIDGAGHLPNLERAGDFNEVLAGFLAQLPSLP